MYGDKDYKSRSADRGTIVGHPAVDFLTLTTWDGYQRDAAEATLGAHYPSHAWTSKVTGRYSGMGIEGLSVGEADQGGQPHFMVQISGHKAHAGLCALIASSGRIDLSLWTCTRIDLQVTCPPVRERPSLAEIGFLTRDGLLGAWRGHRQPKIMVMSSSDGDTVYFGAPSSDKRVRLYDKPVLIKSEKEIYERYEVQCRSRYAQGVLKKIVKHADLSRSAMWEVLNRELDKMPLGTTHLLAAAWDGIEHGAADADGVARPATAAEGSRMQWIRTALRVAKNTALEGGLDGARIHEALATALLQIILEQSLVFPPGYALLDLSIAANRDFAHVADGVYALGPESNHEE